MRKTDEEKKAIAMEAVAYKMNGNGTYFKFASEAGIDRKTLRLWIQKYTTMQEEECVAFVRLPQEQKLPAVITERQIHISYFGAEMDIEEDSLEAVLKAVRAASRYDGLPDL